MKEESKYALDKLNDAFRQLKEGARQAKDELTEDGVIQRFEFTFELFWKAIKIFLEKQGIIARAPRDVFKEAFRLEWLDNEETFLNMLEDRNKTVHVYDRTTSREIVARIKNEYIPAVEKVIQKLTSILSP